MLNAAHVINARNALEITDPTGTCTRNYSSAGNVVYRFGIMGRVNAPLQKFYVIQAPHFEAAYLKLADRIAQADPTVYFNIVKAKVSGGAMVHWIEIASTRTQ